MGSVIKCMMYYREAFWRRKGRWGEQRTWELCANFDTLLSKNWGINPREGYMCKTPKSNIQKSEK